MLLDLVHEIDDAELIGKPGLAGDLSIDAADFPVLDQHPVLVGLFHRHHERLARVQLEVLSQFFGLELGVTFDDHVADLVPCSLGDHKGQVDLPRLGARPGHWSDLRLEKALRLVVFDELLAVLVEHVGVILAEQPQDRLPRGDLDP